MKVEIDVDVNRSSDGLDDVGEDLGRLDGSAVSDGVNLELDNIDEALDLVDEALDLVDEGRGVVANVVVEATADGDTGKLLGAVVGGTEGGELAGIKIGVSEKQVATHPLMMARLRM